MNKYQENIFIFLNKTNNVFKQINPEAFIYRRTRTQRPA